jgi:hypothetical protein
VITDYHLRVMKKPKLINLSEQRKWETRLKFTQGQCTTFRNNQKTKCLPGMLKLDRY